MPFRSLAVSFSSQHLTNPAIEVKLLLALGTGALLLFALGALATSFVLHSKQNFEVIGATATLGSSVRRVGDMLEDLELLEQRYRLFGEERDLTRSKVLRGQLSVSLHRLEQIADRGLVEIGSLPRLTAQIRAEHVALDESIRLRPNPSTALGLDVAQTQPDKHSFASLRGRLAEMNDAEKLALSQHVEQQGAWHRELMTVSTAIAGSAAALFLFVCSLIWSKLAGNQQSQYATFDLSPVAAKQLPSPSSPATDDVKPIVEAARAEERASIARDIHDELGALLMAIKIDLKCSSKTGTTLRRAVDSQWPVMLHRVDAAMSAVARIAGQLRPILVDQIGLWPAIESYVREFEEVTKIPCNLQIDVSDPPFKGEIAHEIFRIIQESLTNVARHAEASRVDIRITVKHGQLEVEIRDDGTGISADQILDRHSFGVAGMFERTRRCGGELHIDGRPESGTKVTLRMPAQAIL